MERELIEANRIATEKNSDEAREAAIAAKNNLELVKIEVEKLTAIHQKADEVATIAEQSAIQAMDAASRVEKEAVALKKDFTEKLAAIGKALIKGGAGDDRIDIIWEHLFGTKDLLEKQQLEHQKEIETLREEMKSASSKGEREKEILAAKFEDMLKKFEEMSKSATTSKTDGRIEVDGKRSTAPITNRYSTQTEKKTQIKQLVGLYKQLRESAKETTKRRMSCANDDVSLLFIAKTAKNQEKMLARVEAKIKQISESRGSNIKADKGKGAGSSYDQKNSL